jgi:histone arginine demethylase JMJD6
MPIPEWSDSEEEKGETSSITIVRSVEELRVLYDEALSLLNGAPQHNHSDRKIQSDINFWKEMQHSLEIEGSHIPVISMISKEQFCDDYVLKSKPVIIQGVVEKYNWPASERWSSIDSLNTYYGSMLFKITELVSPLGMGKPYPVRLPLSLYIEYCQNNTVDFPYYLFDRNLSHPERKQLLSDYTVPEYFTDDLYDMSPYLRNFLPEYRYLVIGGNRTGSSLHVDPKCTSAWNTLLLGRKKWVLFPPNQTEEYKERIGLQYTSSTTPPAYWWMDFYPKLKESGSALGMIECIQEPGDTIFVPAGWWHVVLNLDFTVAITQNLLIPETLPFVWKELSDTWPNFSKKLANIILKKKPEYLENIDIDLEKLQELDEELDSDYQNDNYDVY